MFLTTPGEAPPAYRQLFGEQKRTTRQKLERYRHTEPRNQTLFQSFKERLENNKLASTCKKINGV